MRSFCSDILGTDESLSPTEVSHIKDALVQRFVWLEAFLQTLEQQMASGEVTPDEALGKWVQAVNTLSGLAKNLGLNKQKHKTGRWTEALLVSGGTNGANHG